MKTKLTKQDLIDDIMDNFDFEQVHKAMALLDWKWGMGDKERIPDIAELRKFARQRLKEAINNPNRYSSSGGFVAKQDKDGGLYLGFVLHEWDTWDSFDAFESVEE